MISIITPVLNGERFIESCIKNVIHQNCPSAQHIIIDGGSTDSTVSIIQAYAGRYPHLRWISEKDRGQSDAMNRGVALAQGGILGFLNVDDYYEIGALQRMSDLFRTLPEPSLLVGNCNVWGDDEVLLGVNKPSRLRMADLLIGDEARYPFPVNPSAYFYHKTLHEKIGLYDTEEQYAMDIDFLLRAIPHVHVVHLDEVLGNYRLIRGTKTFADMEAGRMDARLQQLILRHKKELPYYQRVRILFMGNLYRSWRSIQKLSRKA